MDSAIHPAYVATIVGPVLADSSLDIGDRKPAGLSIVAEIQYLYRLYWVSTLVLNPNPVFPECTGFVGSTVDHPAIVLNGFFLDNVFVLAYHQTDPTYEFGLPLDRTDHDTRHVVVYVV